MTTPVKVTPLTKGPDGKDLDPQPSTEPTKTPQPGVTKTELEPEPTPAKPASAHAALSDEDKVKRLDLYVATIGDQGTRLNEQDTALQTLRTEVEALKTGPPPTPDDQAKEYFKNPVEVIRRELETSIAPLREFVSNFQAGDKYTQIKAALKVSPAFSGVREVFDGGTLEGYLDKAMEKQEISQATVMSAALGVLGMKEAGMLPDIPAAPITLTPTGDPPVDVPTTRPSPPPAPKGTPVPLRTLTENEERVRREWGMTQEEYLKELEGDTPMVMET